LPAVSTASFNLSGGILAQFCLSITAGEDRFSWFIVGDEGSLRIPHSGPVIVRQRHDDDQPVELEIASADKVVPSTELIQHTWNRLIEDFIGAVRNDDKYHESYPSLPTLTDGLRTGEVIDAPAGRAALDGGQPLADEGALEGPQTGRPRWLPERLGPPKVGLHGRIVVLDGHRCGVEVIGLSADQRS
jgi:hypothetical protein